MVAIAILLIVVGTVLVATVSHPKTMGLPIDGKITVVRVDNIRSYGSFGYPPRYEYVIGATTGDSYRLSEKFNTPLETNTNFGIKEGSVIFLTCERISGSSKDNPKNNPSSPNWCCTTSDKNLFFGCRMINGLGII